MARSATKEKARIVAAPKQLWLPNPPDGTPICLGFDGSLNNDWTALQAETMAGYSFTPRVGKRRETATYWDPKQHGDRIPHGAVEAAVDELFDRFHVVRLYGDPHDWDTDLEEWALTHGAERVIPWATNRPSQMYDEIVRFENDLREGRITHDGDPTAAVQMLNAKRAPRPGQRYILQKPSELQKIDIAMAKILAHTAVRDSIAAGWEMPRPKKMRVFR